MIVAVLFLVASVAAAASVWWKLHQVFTHARLLQGDMPPEAELPSVSLCIPARNETHAMTDCLESALSSDYPKLEIIVLDDGSRDNTGELIRSFAHAGIRFVEGSPLPDGWLGKNHALESLAQEASGSLLLFADVDTRFGVKSISQLVSYMVGQHADMVSVLPARGNPLRASAVLATFRHFWNLLGHSTQKPAVASSAWMIRRDTLLDKLQGFSAVATDVRPEKSIAKGVVAGGGTYRFVLSDSRLGVSYEKKLSSQYETALRIYYPDFGLGGVLWRVAGLLVCLSPYVLVVTELIVGEFGLAMVALGVTLLFSLINAWYLGVLRSNNYGLASVCLPFLMVREMYLLVASAVAYARGSVVWKGRPVRTVAKRS